MDKKVTEGAALAAASLAMVPMLPFILGTLVVTLGAILFFAFGLMAMAASGFVMILLFMLGVVGFAALFAVGYRLAKGKWPEGTYSYSSSTTTTRQ